MINDRRHFLEMAGLAELSIPTVNLLHAKSLDDKKKQIINRINRDDQLYIVFCMESKDFTN